MVLLEPFQQPEPTQDLRQHNAVTDGSTAGILFPRLSQVSVSRPMTHWSSFGPCYGGHVLPPPYVSFSDTWFYHDFPVSRQMKSTKPSSLSTLHMEHCQDLSFFLSLLCRYTQCVPASLKVWLSLSKRLSIESWRWKICTDDSCQGIQVQTFHCLPASKSLVSKRTVLEIFICLFSCIFLTTPHGLERTWALTTWELGPHSLDHSWDTFTKNSDLFFAISLRNKKHSINYYILSFFSPYFTLYLSSEVACWWV